MFPIRIGKLDNISVLETYRWKALFVGFLAIRYIRFQDQRRVYGKLAKK